jgi:amino-acid N-acetyltransferase
MRTPARSASYRAALRGAVTDPVAAIAIEEGRASDLPAMARLLEHAGLPLAGVDDSLRVIVARAEPKGRIVGAAALEEYPNGALLRSVVVDEKYRGERLGQRLTHAALDLASRRGHRTAYLLTTTAANFFPRFGFTRIDRAEVPDDVRTSIEFTSACPSTAIVMRADLKAGRAGGAG